MVFKGVPRERIPWFPRLDEEKCVGCGGCFNFCKNGVYRWDEENNRPQVVAPYNCVVGCSACANLCEQEAIVFPSMAEIRKAVASGRDKTD